MPGLVTCLHPSCKRSFDSQGIMLKHYKEHHSAHQQHGAVHHIRPSFKKKPNPPRGAPPAHRHQRNQFRPAAAAAAADANQKMLAPRPRPAAPGTLAAYANPKKMLAPRPAPLEDVACNDCGKLFKSTDSLHHHQWDLPYHTRVAQGPSSRSCSKCSAKFDSADQLEQHYVKRHPISEVPESSEKGTWQHVAGCFTSAWKKPEIKLYEVLQVFQVYNPGRRRKDYEEYRKGLKKNMANLKLDDSDPEVRKMVLQDGNELRRYHGTTVKCRLGRPSEKPGQEADDKKTSSLCTSTDCSLCRILQTGFKKSKCRVKAFQRFGKGIYSTSVSSKASEYVKCSNKKSSFLSCFNLASLVNGNHKVMLACRVLAGRPYRSTVNLKKLDRPPRGFHSVQGDTGVKLNYDELVVYDNRAILPAFIILYSSSDS